MKYKKVCMNCLKGADSCNCFQPDIVEIDKEMVSIIKGLNRKGYLTLGCCGGHSGSSLYMYVQFAIDYDVKTPKGFEAEITEGKLRIVFKDMNFYKIKFFEQLDLIKEKQVILRDWAKELEKRPESIKIPFFELKKINLKHIKAMPVGTRLNYRFEKISEGWCKTEEQRSEDGKLRIVKIHYTENELASELARLNIKLEDKKGEKNNG